MLSEKTQNYKASVRKIEKEFKFYQNNPEEHPLYATEW